MCLTYFQCIFPELQFPAICKCLAAVTAATIVAAATTTITSVIAVDAATTATTTTTTTTTTAATVTTTTATTTTTEQNITLLHSGRSTTAYDEYGRYKFCDKIGLTHISIKAEFI